MVRNVALYNLSSGRPPNNIEIIIGQLSPIYFSLALWTTRSSPDFLLALAAMSLEFLARAENHATNLATVLLGLRGNIQQFLLRCLLVHANHNSATGMPAIKARIF
jgi:hypothetical protein